VFTSLPQSHIIMNFFRLEEKDLDLLDVLQEESPRDPVAPLGSQVDDYIDSDGLLDDDEAFFDSNEAHSTGKMSENDVMNKSSAPATYSSASHHANYPKEADHEAFPQKGTVHLLPATSAEAIMTNATSKLRASGMAFMNDKNTALQSLEEFRECFYGGSEGTDGADVDDDERVVVCDEDDCVGASGHGLKKRKRTAAGSGTTKNAPAKRSNNPDAELIASATEKQMALLEIDPNGREGKQQRRRIRNRMSAQLHRERKAMYIDALEAFVRIKEGRINALEGQVRQFGGGLVHNNSIRYDQQKLTGPTAHVSVSSGSDSSVTGTSTNGSSNGCVGSRSDSATGGSEGDIDTESMTSASASSVDPVSPLHAGVQGDSLSHEDLLMLDDALGLDLGVSEEVSLSGSADSSMLRTEFGGRSSTRNKRTRGNTGVKISGSMRHVLPLLSVVCMVALCFSGESGTSLVPVGVETSSSAMTAAAVEDTVAPALHASRRLLSISSAEESESEGMTEFGAKIAPVPTHIAQLLSETHAATNTAAMPSVTSEGDFKGGNWATGSSTNTVDEADMSKQLWAYTRDDMLMTLYPNVYMQKNRSPRNLRGAAARGTLVSTASVVDPSASNALVALDTTLHGNAHTSGSKHSRVIMRDGKALLDPAMALTKTSVTPQHIGSFSQQDQSNELRMLLPTNNIRWGLNWGDSVDGTTAALLDSLRLAGGAQHIPNIDGSLDNMYIELVCTISSAQLVKNVTKDM